MKEIWKDIELGSCIYSISNFGNVFNKTRNRVQPTFLEGRGYVSFSTQKNKIKNNYKVHRLVAMFFIPNPENKPTINHKNGIKTDNRVENLEWATYSENNIHAIKTGLKNYWYNSKKVSCFKNGKEVMSYNSVSEAARKLGVHKDNIYDCLRGKRKNNYLGYEWKYI